jgi:lysophospholipase L1-like esterase
MINSKKTLPLLMMLFLLFATSCTDETEYGTITTTNTGNNGGGENVNTTFPVGGTILPLGDSRIEGAHPTYESYRYELWKNLVDRNWSFDFVGSKTEEGSYPSYNGLDFDLDHEGTGGAVTTDILATLQAVLTPATAPNVVLLGIGGNDLLGGSTSATTIGNVNTIIDLLQENNAGITIFLEQIAPAMSSQMTPELIQLINEYNASILAVGLQQTNSTSSVFIVDMNSNWTDNYMADDVHYNEAGAKEIADRYMAAIEAAY